VFYQLKIKKRLKETVGFLLKERTTVMTLEDIEMECFF